MCHHCTYRHKANFSALKEEVVIAKLCKTSIPTFDSRLSLQTEKINEETVNLNYTAVKTTITDQLEQSTELQLKHSQVCSANIFPGLVTYWIIKQVFKN